MRFLLPMAAAGLVIAPQPAAAAEPLHLKPSSKWVLDYAEDSCRLARQFGEGDRRVTLRLDQLEPGDAFRVNLIGKPARTRRGDLRVTGRLRFGPGEPESEFSAMSGKAEALAVLVVEGNQRLAPLTEAEKAADYHETGANPRPIGTAREAAATWLEIRQALVTDLVLETGPMDEPLAALRQCSWDTVKDWGFDVEQQKALSRRPVPRPKSVTWLQPEDYPVAMLSGGYQGFVHYRLMVDAAGKPISCHVQLSTRPKEFDKAVCSAVMKRAGFEPALDAAGNPVPSYWTQSVQFRLEEL